MSRRSLLLGLVAALAALAAAGCGREAEPRVYELPPTKACLEAADLPVSTRDVDFVASTALGGALNARFPRPRNEVTISFGESEADAARTERAYRNFAPKRLRIDDVLRRDSNVVMLWAVGPTEKQSKTVSDCLRS